MACWQLVTGPTGGPCTAGAIIGAGLEAGSEGATGSSGSCAWRVGGAPPVKGGDTWWTGQGCHGAPWSKDAGCCAVGDRRFADCAGGLTACGCVGPGWQRWDGRVAWSVGGEGKDEGFFPPSPATG